MADGRSITELPLAASVSGGQVVGIKDGTDMLFQLGGAAGKDVGSGADQVPAGNHTHAAETITDLAAFIDGRIAELQDGAADGGVITALRHAHM